MLTDNDVHYLVGFLQLISTPELVETELGSMIFDSAAAEERDVDITMTYRDAEGSTVAMSGIEVKAHGRSLDVTHVEQLSAKLRDMPSITKRVIVSASGYTEGAINKAKAHSVELYALEDWDPTVKLFATDVTELANAVERRLSWGHADVRYVSPSLSSKKNPCLKSTSRIYGSNGKLLSDPPNVHTLTDNILRNSLDQIKDTEPFSSLPANTRQDLQVEVTLPERPCIRVGSKLHEFTKATVSGHVSWTERSIPLVFKCLRRIPDRTPIIGCGLVEFSTGDLVGLTVAPILRPVTMLRIEASRRRIRPRQHPIR